MRVVLSDAAKADLIEIGDFIARDSPRRALDFIDMLKTKALETADIRLAYPLIPRYEKHGIRRRPYGDYLIFYRIEHDEISIIRILHGARDYVSVLFAE